MPINPSPLKNLVLKVPDSPQGFRQPKHSPYLKEPCPQGEGIDVGVHKGTPKMHSRQIAPATEPGLR